jgi:hypothetical protein
MSYTPLPTTGPISLSQFPAAFGSPTSPISLSQYTRGGLYIPSNDSTLSSIPNTDNSTRSIGQYRGMSLAVFVATYSINWSYGGDTYYGYCDIYTNGRIELRQEIWCPHGAGWWGRKRTNINLWNNTASRLTQGQLVLSDPYSNKELVHTGTQLVFRQLPTILRSVNAPLST